MKRFLFICTLLVAASLCAPSLSALDVKYMKSMAGKIRDIHPEMFNPAMEIPDSLQSGYDAVILSELDYVDADYQSAPNQMRPITTIKSMVFCRKMVKILSPKGVEEFSKHEFGQKDRTKIAFITIAESKNAFGATIHKPDGEVIEVDLNQAFNVTSGKNDNSKNTIYSKIDIPGLEPGDVLDYFYCREEKVNEFDLAPSEFVIPAEYPIMKLRIEFALHPTLTCDCRAYNDAPPMNKTTGKENRNCLYAEFSNVPVVTDRMYMNKHRQLPFYFLTIANHTSPFRKYYPKRSGGLSQNLAGSFHINNLMRHLLYIDASESGMGSKINSLYKNYIKNNPDTAVANLLDGAWCAVEYANRTNSDLTYENGLKALIFADFVSRKILPADSLRLVLINPRDEVPLKDIGSPQMAHVGVECAGRLYIFDYPDNYAPGEIPPQYQGETGAAYSLANRKSGVPPLSETFQFSKKNSNVAFVSANLTLGDNGDITGSGALELKGGSKILAADLNSPTDIDRALEDMIGIEPNKRFNPKTPYENSQEADARKEEQENRFRNYLFNGDDINLSSYDVISNGLKAASPVFKVNFEVAAPASTIDAGDEMLVPIGKFAGNFRHLDGHDRERMTDIYMPVAETQRTVINLKVPEGFAADEASVASLAKEVRNRVGYVGTQASIDDDGSITLSVMHRINRDTFTFDYWPEVVQLHDARADINDAVVVLTKKL
jgi:hypothetical protein